MLVPGIGGASGRLERPGPRPAPVPEAVAAEAAEAAEAPRTTPEPEMAALAAAAALAGPTPAVPRPRPRPAPPAVPQRDEEEADEADADADADADAEAAPAAMRPPGKPAFERPLPNDGPLETVDAASSMDALCAALRALRLPFLLAMEEDCHSDASPKPKPKPLALPAAPEPALAPPADCSLADAPASESSSLASDTDEAEEAEADAGIGVGLMARPAAAPTTARAVDAEPTTAAWLAGLPANPAEMAPDAPPVPVALLAAVDGRPTGTGTATAPRYDTVFPTAAAAAAELPALLDVLAALAAAPTTGVAAVALRQAGRLVLNVAGSAGCDVAAAAGALEVASAAGVASLATSLSVSFSFSLPFFLLEAVASAARGREGEAGAEEDKDRTGRAVGAAVPATETPAGPELVRGGVVLPAVFPLPDDDAALAEVASTAAAAGSTVPLESVPSATWKLKAKRRSDASSALAALSKPRRAWALSPQLTPAARDAAPADPGVRAPADAPADAPLLRSLSLSLAGVAWLLFDSLSLSRASLSLSSAIMRSMALVSAHWLCRR